MCVIFLYFSCTLYSKIVTSSNFALFSMPKSNAKIKDCALLCKDYTLQTPIYLVDKAKYGIYINCDGKSFIEKCEEKLIHNKFEFFEEYYLQNPSAGEIYPLSPPFCHNKNFRGNPEAAATFSITVYP